MNADLQGKIALVTGGSKGIGRAIALKLAENGADVVINARNPEPAFEIVKQIEGMGRKCIFEKADLISYTEVKKMTENILHKWGKIDILVASGVSGYPPARFFHETEPELYGDHFKYRVNLRLNCVRAVLDHMRDRQKGKIIIITTDSGRVPTPGESMIGATGAALILLTKVLAREFARWKIHINAISLTVTIDTPSFERALRYESTGKVFKKASEKIPFWPIIPKDIAELALFLCSEDSDRITGQIFSVNGGLSFPG